MINIVFRTNGGGNMGYGHLYRCISLAKAIKSKSNSINILFIVNDLASQLLIKNNLKYRISANFDSDYEIYNNLKPNLVIWDSYLGNNKVLRNISENYNLMIFDDNNDIYDSNIPKIVLNGNIHAKYLDYKSLSGTKFLLGPKYLVMKEEYWQNNISNKNNYHENTILITTGGSDHNNVSPEILEVLSGNSYIKEMVIGPGYKKNTIDKIKEVMDGNTRLLYSPESLKSSIFHAKFVITAAGSTVYEVLSQNVQPIVYTLADNQKLAYNHFENRGILTIGEYPDINYNKLLNIINKDNLSSTDVNFLVDGQGALRVAEFIVTYINCHND